MARRLSEIGVCRSGCLAAAQGTEHTDEKNVAAGTWSAPLKVALANLWLSSHLEDEGMPHKKHKPEEIVAELRQGDVLGSEGQSVAEVVWSIGATQFTCY